MNECRKLHVQGGWQGSVTVADGKVEPRGTAGRNERVWTHGVFRRTRRRAEDGDGSLHTQRLCSLHTTEQKEVY